MADTPAPTAASTATDPSILDYIDTLMRTNTGKGAAMGALAGQLLSSAGSSGGVNLGVDMSKVGTIAPRSTQIGAARYIPYSQYSAMEPVSKMSPELSKQFGVPTGGLQRMVPAQSNAIPAFVSGTAPTTYTAAGTGVGHQTNPLLTPRSTNKISPLTGALLGSAVGYLTAPSTSSTSTAGMNALRGIGSGLSSGLSGLLSGFKKQTLPTNSNAPNYDASGVKTDASGNDVYVDTSGTAYDVYGNPTGPYVPYGGQTGGFPINTDIGSNPYINLGDYTGGAYDYGTSSSDGNTYDNFPVYKEGGMATPLMADGGSVPHYYTYGQAVDPKEVLAGYAKGGEMQQSGLPTHVPTIEGRHDYRAGSRVTGEGDGTSDDIPAMLADGEYVFSADVVSALGNGSTKAGANRLDDMVEQIRSRDRSTHPSELPPDAKSPLQYLKQSRSK